MFGSRIPPAPPISRLDRGWLRPSFWAWIAGLILALVGALGARTLPTEPPDTGWLKIPVTGTREKPPVWFSHRLHAQRRVACEQCHHEYQGERNVWRQGQPVQLCQACHGPTRPGQRLDLKNAFHRQCKGCHVKLRQQRRPAGPINCQGCHRRT